MTETWERAKAFFLRANQLREHGDYRQAVEAYRGYRDAQQSFLEMALLHNLLGYRSPWKIEPLAQSSSSRR